MDLINIILGFVVIILLLLYVQQVLHVDKLKKEILDLKEINNDLNESNDKLNSNLEIHKYNLGMIKNVVERKGLE